MSDVPDTPKDTYPAERLQKKQSDRMALWIPLASTFVAVVAALAALWSGYEAHQARIQDERPYVRVEYAGYGKEQVREFGTDNMTSEPFPHVKLDVFGRSPAVKIRILSWCGAKEQAEFPIETMNASQNVLFPGESRIDYCPFTENVAAVPMTPVLYGGVVTYQDVSGHEFRTPFCFAKMAKDSTSAEYCFAKEKFE